MWISGAFVFTLELEFITIILESPVDATNSNCIDVFQFQLAMNSALLLLKFWQFLFCLGNRGVVRVTSVIWALYGGYNGGIRGYKGL